MFTKPIKIKSNVQLKSSERKKLRDIIIAKYSTIVDSDFDKIFPNKSNISHVKITTQNNQKINVYTTDKRPMFFEHNDVLYPTVYTLWILPDLLSLFTTHTIVLGRMANGADLMLPGVIKQGQGRNAYGYCKKNELIGVNITSNKAPIAIGLLLKSSEDFCMSDGAGVFCKILHVYGDKLWDIEPSVCLQTPNLGVAFDVPTNDDFPALGTKTIQPKPKKTDYQSSQSLSSPSKIIASTSTTTTLSSSSSSILLNTDKNTQIINQKSYNKNKNQSTKEINENDIVAHIEQDDNVCEANDNDDDDDENVCNSNDTDDNDKLLSEEDLIKNAIIKNDFLLKNAFLIALKRDGKTLQLPILTSNFYRCHVLPAIPEAIDLKQTTYKKLSKFLYEMSRENFITVREFQKGVEKIIAINLKNQQLIEYELPARDLNVTNNINDLFISEMTELYIITEQTIKLFTQFNLAIGDGLEYRQVRVYLTEYAHGNKLIDTTNNSRTVHLNKLLSDICNNDDDDQDDKKSDSDTVKNVNNHSDNKTDVFIKFDDLFAIIISKMRHTYEMRSKNANKQQKIQMSLAKRSGNKLVTIVTNLESFGIRINEFMKACKIGVAASTTLIPASANSNQKSDHHLMVQGNQIHFIYNLLVATYKIPPKNIIGLELARKEKKQKKK